MDYQKYQNNLERPGVPRWTDLKRKEALNNLEKNRVYREEDARLHNLFKEDLFKELKIENNPKKETLFNIAYDHAHSNGYRQVFLYAEGLVELLR